MVNKTIKGLTKVATKIIITVAIILVIIFSAQTAFNFGFNLTKQSEKINSRDVAIEIPQGASTSMIADILEENGVVDSALMFRIGARMNGYDGMFKYGNYVLNTGMSEEEIMQTLMSEGAKAKQIKLTIPEGYSVYQIAELLEEQNICTAEEFFEAANSLDYDYDFIQYIPSRDDEKSIALEGYLFPETYFIDESATARDIVDRLLSQFDQVYTNEYTERAVQLGYSLDEIVTIASVIEREAKIDTERPMMSSVIYNRTNQNMPLQMCSTVLYAQGRVGEPVTRLLFEDLEIESPYNTYKYAGLPLGPISNPGKKSLEATLYPDETDYLYFVLIDELTGEHHFSVTLEEHNAYK